MTGAQASHGFELEREEEIPELQTRAKIYRHGKSGAELLSLENRDENKCFGITFRTPPSDSTGVAHIVEHTVLCGSKKYPLKDPFIELYKSSLQTFLNAFTFPDKTCYPVASQNLRDFYNLVDVYLDTVFNPLLLEKAFAQEAWHYDLQQSGEPLSYKGVVFNEMKGAYSSPDDLMEERARQSLFPDTPYCFDFAGHPEHIPELTYEDFKNFHQRFYHPSNARIFFAGDDDPEERLRLLDVYLQSFDCLDIDSSIKLQPECTEPHRIVHPYGISSGGDAKGIAAVNWLLPTKDDVETFLGLQILSHILVGTPASPLRKALIESGLGEDIAGMGFESELLQLVFSTGLKGIQPGDADKVEDLILVTLEGLSTEGIDQATVEASLNTVEFSLRENNTGGFPRGLGLMLRSLSTWLYDGDPLAPMAFEALLAAVKNKFASGKRYFEDLIETHLIRNRHRTLVVLEPDAELLNQQEEEQQGRLRQARAGMDEDDLQRLADETQALIQFQQTPDPPEVVATLPSLARSDLERKVRTVPIEVHQSGSAEVLYHDLFTSDILYIDLGFDLHSIPEELLPYIPLLGRGFLEMGTEKEDFVSLSQRIGRYTGGVHPHTLVQGVIEGDGSVSRLFFRAKAMVPQADELLAILTDVLTTVRLDKRARFLQIVLEEKARLEANLIPSGSQMVLTRLRSRLTQPGWLSEQTGGITYLFFLRRLVDRIENDWVGVLVDLESARSHLINQAGLVVNVTVDGQSWEVLQPKLTGFIRGLPKKAIEPFDWTRETVQSTEGLTVPAQVNFVGKAANLFDTGYSVHGTALVIEKFLSTGYLWDRVRLQGGAYGCSCVFDPFTGILGFVSYRDPNILETLSAYDEAGAFLRVVDLPESEVTRAVIGAIGAMDKYQLPDAKGFSSLVRYLSGYSDETRQRVRDEILGATADDFRSFAQVLDAAKENGLVAALGSGQAIDEVNKARPGFFEVKPVL